MSTVNIAVAVDRELLDSVRTSHPFLSFDEACQLAVHMHLVLPVAQKLAASTGTSFSLKANIGPWQIPIYGDAI